jgi:hypothetical protein
MQRKRQLLYRTMARAVFEDVKAHLQDKSIIVPPEWELESPDKSRVVALVFLGCNPCMTKAPPADGPDFKFLNDGHKGLMCLFQDCFARYPDLTLKILSLTRKFVGDYQNHSKNKTKLVRLFLWETPHLIKENGKYRTPRGDEIDILWKLERGSDPKFKQEIILPKDGKPPLKSVPTASLQDGEIATILSEPGCDVLTETVKKARQSLSASAEKKKGQF